MSNYIKIKKGGLRQTVGKAAYEKLYKPYGWEIDETKDKVDEVEETVKKLATENEVKNYLSAKKRTPKKFNDNLFKSEEGKK